MHKTIRQMILGFGTFGTGTALLYLEVNPYLLVLTDTVVGVGMLFAAGSITVDDLRPGRRRAQGEVALIEEVAAPAPAIGKEENGGLRASLGRLRHPFRPAVKEPGPGKGEKEDRTQEIDRMLDTTLAGQSKRLISLAEGRGAPPGPAGTAAEPAGEDLLQQLSAGGISAQFPDEEAAEEEEDIPRQGSGGPGIPGEARTSPAGLEGRGEAQVDVLTLADEELGTDDLLSALRAEAMREKKKDDTSLLRNLKGVKVTGKQLLDELDSLVRDLRGR